MSDLRKITLHPILEDGTIDLSVNLYPKTFLNGIVGENGQEVEVALKSDIPEIPTNYVTTDTYQDISGYKKFNNRTVFEGGIALGSGLRMLIDGEAISDVDIKYEDPSLCAPVRLNLGVARIDSAKLVLGNCDKSASTYSDLGNAYIRRVYKTSNESGEFIDVDKAYLLIPNKGTKQNPETLATVSECGTKLYRHHINVQVTTLSYEDYEFDYYITTTSSNLIGTEFLSISILPYLMIQYKYQGIYYVENFDDDDDDINMNHLYNQIAEVRTGEEVTLGDITETVTEL